MIDVLDRLRMLHGDAERISSKLPTEEMFLRFSEEVVNVISDYIAEVEAEE